MAPGPVERPPGHGRQPASQSVRLLVSTPAEPLPEDGGPTSPWGVSRNDRCAEPNAEPVSSPRRPLGRSEVPGETAKARFHRGHAPDLAQSQPGSDRSDRCRCDRRHGRLVAADHRPPRWSRAAWPGRPGCRPVPGQPARRLFGSAGTALPAPVRAAPADRGGALVTLPFLPTPPVIIAATMVFWLSLSFSSPFQLRLWGATYPARMRGRVVGFLGTGRAAAAAMAGGILADRLGGPTVIAMAGVVGALCALAYAGFRASAASVPLAYSARQSLRALRARPMLGRVALAQGGGSSVAASSRPVRCSPWSTWTGWTCPCPTWA